jgi:hypothetical protein
MSDSDYRLTLEEMWGRQKLIVDAYLTTIYGFKPLMRTWYSALDLRTKHGMATARVRPLDTEN